MLGDLYFWIMKFLKLFASRGARGVIIRRYGVGGGLYCCILCESCE